MTPANKSQVLAKIEFLETQLNDLNHYLPETYDYLLQQLDHQKRILAEREVQETFQTIDSTCTETACSGAGCS
jgi:hypothetical protein